MKSNHWRASLPQQKDNQAIRSWLTEPGSLTARLKKHARYFCVRLVCQGLQKRLPDDAVKASSRSIRVREVVLECDGQPVIFAHTVLSTATRGRLSLWLERLGSRSLGSLLFAHPAFVRGEIEYCRLDVRHPLYRRAAAFSSASPVLWARRSSHRLGAQEVVVTEVFLPAIAGLQT